MSKRARTPPAERGGPGSGREAGEIKKMKEDLKNLADKVLDEQKKGEATKTEVEAWYTFAGDYRAKFAQHLFYFGEIDNPRV